MCVRALVIKCIFGSIFLSSQLAHATLTDQGSTTLDTSTGLTWLDLNFSTNRSISDVVINLKSGGQFEGYRYATKSELTSFFVHAGFGPGFFQNSDSSFPPFSTVNALLGLVGVTRSEPSGDKLKASYAYYAESVPSQYGIGFLASWIPIPSVYQSQADIYAVQTSLDAAVVEYGSWLVHSASVVPEPSSFVLLFLGVLALTTKRFGGPICRLYSAPRPHDDSDPSMYRTASSGR
jgi:hypothetical protein